MAAIDVKPVKVFTRESPCTKVDLYNCFRRGDGFIPRPTVQTRGEIGENAPKYLRREGYARLYEANGIDCLELTDEGEAWLLSGLARYLEMHPEEVANLEQPYPGVTEPRRTVTRALSQPRTSPIRLKRSRPK